MDNRFTSRVNAVKSSVSLAFFIYPKSVSLISPVSGKTIKASGVISQCEILFDSKSYPISISYVTTGITLLKSNS